MKFPHLFPLGLFLMWASHVHAAAQSIGSGEILSSYAWGSVGGLSGVYYLNIWNDSTGEFLSEDNHDRADVIVIFQSSVGALGAGGYDYTASDTIRSSHSFNGTVAANNPGSQVVNTMTILFADHLTVTGLTADFNSLNSTGLTWETSRMAALTTSGGYFSEPLAPTSYQSYTPVQGSSSEHQGFYYSDSKATVNGVGTSTTSTGTATAALESLSGTAGNSYLDYTDLNLATGTQIGGFEWLTRLMDTRGTSNNGSNLTSTMTSFTVTGIIVPEPAAAGLLATGLLHGLLRRRRV